MKNIESQFEDAKTKLTLSTSEKDFHRAQVATFVRNNPKVIPSPFSEFFFPTMRYAFASLLVVAISGTGIVFAAEKSLPGDTLYAVKTKVSEPMHLALTFDPKEKADLEVELVSRRLKEVALVSVSGDLDADALVQASDSLSDTIDAAQENITTLQNNNDTDTAFETASNLQGTLSAHAKILQKVKAAAPTEAQDIESIASTVESESDQTDTLVDATATAVNNTNTTTLEAQTDDQHNDTLDSLEKIKINIEDALGSFDTSDRADVATSLDEINTIIAQAKTKYEAGDVKGAYLLYTDADQKITELKTLIEADQALNIDVID